MMETSSLTTNTMSKVVLGESEYQLDPPFGSLPVDISMDDVRGGRPLALSTSSQVLSISNDRFVAKTFSNLDIMHRELDITHLAGDCAVPIVGRVRHTDGQIYGFVMPFEAVLSPPSIPSLADRTRIIHDLCDLTQRFHQKGLVHGDIKPANVLRCSDGSLRFCDFATSSRVGENYKTTLFSMQYASTRRYRAVQPEILTPAEDFHALGMSIWEICVGNDDFWGLGICSSDDPETYNQLAEDAVNAGLRPIMDPVDKLDPDISRLITTFLDKGPPYSDIFVQTDSMCIETEHALRNCSQRPDPHTFIVRSKCSTCEDEERETCSYLHRKRQVVMDVGPSTPICTICLNH